VSVVNRTLLGVLGLLLVLSGALVLLITTNRLNAVLRQLGTARRQPPADGPMMPAGVAIMPDPALLAIVAFAALLVAGLSTWWLVAQFPRRRKTPDFRLSADVAHGTTVVTLAALSSAISGQLEQLPGVLSAQAVVRGAVQATHLVVRVTVDDRSDVAAVMTQIVAEVGGGLGEALGTKVDSLQVLVGIGHQDRTAAAAVL
jgi:hypothetical protein